MHRWIRPYRFIETLGLTLLVEEAVLVTLRNEEVELEVAPRELHTARDGRPLAEGDRLVLGCAIGQRIAADDVFSEHIAETFFIACRTALFANLVNHFGKQPFTTSLGVVGQNVDAVAGADGDEALELPFSLGFEALQKGEFAAQNLDEKVAVAAGGLEEAAVEPERLIAHQVEHSVHLSWIGEHLAMVSHSLAAFDLFCVFVVRHKKSWNFAYAHLGVPRPA